MKTLSNKEINYSLHNNENFKKELEYEISDVIDKISQLLTDYFKFIIENIKRIMVLVVHHLFAFII